MNPGARRLVLLGLAPPLLLAVVAVGMCAAGITGVDTAAHVYKQELLNDSLGSLFWDNYWYGGVYGIIDYGPLFYLLALLVPSAVLVVVAAGCLPLLLHLYLTKVYGVRDVLPAAALAVVLCFYLANGQAPFLVGLALMVGGMVLLSRRRRTPAAVAFGAALFCNPLSVLTAGVFLLADLVACAGLRRDYVVTAAWFMPFLFVRVALSLLFRQPAAYFDQFSQIARPLGFALAGAVLVWFSGGRERRHRLTLFLVYAAVCLAAWALPSLALGNNVNRFLMVFGLPAVLLVRGPRLAGMVAVLAVLGVAWLQLETPARHLFSPPVPQAADAAFFRPALTQAARLADTDHRLHVVALKKHWESYYFPREGYAITRGWYRQSDELHNRLFLMNDYDETDYVEWLRSMGVELVFLPHAPLDFTSEREPAILAGSRSFTVAARVPHWTIYRLRDPRPLLVGLRGAPDGRVRRLGHREILLDCPVAGDYLLKVSWSPYWQAHGFGGARATVLRAPAGFILLRVSSPGRSLLSFVVDGTTLRRAL